MQSSGAMALCINHCIVLLSASLVLSACSSTERSSNEDKESLTTLSSLVTPKIDIPTPVNSPSIHIELQQDAQTEEGSGVFLQQQIERQQPIIIEDQPTLPKDLNNRQICKDDVEVTYKVKDGSGYLNAHFAFVQLQGRLKRIDTETKELMIELQSWYSHNQNLLKWSPYLTEPPKYKVASLRPKEQIWDDAEGWYLCRFTDEKTQNI